MIVISNPIPPETAFFTLTLNDLKIKYIIKHHDYFTRETNIIFFKFLYSNVLLFTMSLFPLSIKFIRCTLKFLFTY